MKQIMKLLFSTIIAAALASGLVLAQEGLTKTKSFTVSKGGTLEVSIRGGDIYISTWDKNEVFVRVEFSDEDELDRVRMTQQGNTIRITDRDRWSGDDNSRYEITIPSQFNIDVRTSSGDLTLRGKLKGNVNGETSAGDIRLGDIEGTIDVHTSGGNVRAGKVVGDATLNTSGGDIDVISASGDLNVRTSGGNIRLGNIGKTLQASTSGGDVVIGNVGGEATVSTSGGNIQVGKVSGKASLKTSGGDIELNGGNGLIRASTSGGNVMLENISGSVDARTAGGDIQAELRPSGKGKSRLSSASGAIWLYLPEDSKATIDARIRIQGSWRHEQDTYMVRSDFKAQSSERNEDEREIRTKYILNGGGEMITLETVNSDIVIKKLMK
jgi:DUF4097 and DUF4098 domain-containing protein YvlB